MDCDDGEIGNEEHYMKRKPMSLNVLLNGIKTVFSLLFPLITFPYITRVLSPEGVGQANYASSIANYFILIGGLGIASYAIREGAKRSYQKEEFQKFADEMWTVSLMSAVFAYVCLVVTLIFSVKLHNYRWLIAIYSFQILSNAIGMEWVLNIYEEYAYVTIRSVIFQILSLVLLLCFVRNPEDVYRYVIIQMISTVGIGLANHIYVRKKLTLKIVFSKKILEHLCPILLIFSTTLATAIYVNLDTTMLGWIWGDEQVGYYTAAAKLYNIVKSLINSVVTVYAVRLSSLYYQDKTEYDKTFKEVFQLITGLTIPMAVGGSLLRNEIIVILGGKEYLAATGSLAVLLASLIFATLGNLFGAGVLLIVKKEKYMFAATLTGTFVNMVLNYIFITKMKCTGAAIATLITEIIVCTILAVKAAPYLCHRGFIRHQIKVIIASILFIPIVLGINQLMIGFWIKLACKIAVCVITYLVTLLLLKDELAEQIIKRNR